MSEQEMFKDDIDVTGKYKYPITGVDTRKKVYCEVHHTRLIQMYCSECDCPVCLACIAGRHAKHSFSEITDIAEEKMNELSKILESLKQEKLPELLSTLQTVREMQQNYLQKQAAFVSEVKVHGQRLKKEVDKLTDRFIEELTTKENTNMKCLRIAEKELIELLSEVKDTINIGNQKMKSQNIELVTFVNDVKRKMDSYKYPVPECYFTIPEFVPSQPDQSSLLKLYGCTVEKGGLGINFIAREKGEPDVESKGEKEGSNVDSTGEKGGSCVESTGKKGTTGVESTGKKEGSFGEYVGDDTAPIPSVDSMDDTTSSYETGSDFVDSSSTGTCVSDNKGIRNFSNKKVKIVSSFKVSKKAAHMCAVNRTNAWISGDGYLELVRCDGQVERSFKMDFGIYGMTLTEKGELLFGTDGKIKKMTNDGQVVDFLNTSPFEVYGMVSTSNKHILACFYDGFNEGKVERLSLKGKRLKTIQYVKHKYPLFRWPIFITQIDSGDIWVSDRNANCVVVVNSDGELKFRYRGPYSIDMEKQFKPKYLSSNKYGQVLINDIGCHNIHLVDQDGNFLHYLLTDDHGFDGRWTLAQEKDNFLWACCSAHSTVILSQYMA